MIFYRCLFSIEKKCLETGFRDRLFSATIVVFSCNNLRQRKGIEYLAPGRIPSRRMLHEGPRSWQCYWERRCHAVLPPNEIEVKGGAEVESSRVLIWCQVGQASYLRSSSTREISFEMEGLATSLLIMSVWNVEHIVTRDFFSTSKVIISLTWQNDYNIYTQWMRKITW